MRQLIASLGEKINSGQLNKKAGRLSTALGLGIVLLLVGYAGLSIYCDGPPLLEYLSNANPWGIALSLPTYSVALGLAIWGWSAIVGMLTGVSGFRKHARIYCYTNLAKRVPGVLWYVLGRIYFYRDDRADGIAVSVASLIEIVLIILSGFVTYLLLGSKAWSNGPSIWLPLGVLLGLVGIHPKILRLILGRIRQAEALAVLRYRELLVWLCLYVGVWNMGGLTLFCVINSIHPISLTHIPAIIGAWSLSGAIASLVIFLPSGLGLREVTLTVMLMPYVPGAIAVVISLLMRILLTMYEILWLLIATRL